MKDACLIVGAGEISPDILSRCGDLSSCLIIAADGGYLRCGELSLTPDLILGDFDSAPKPATTAETQVFSSHKDDTDCMLAAKEGLRRGCRRFTLIGCTGGRLDHTIANIQTLLYLVNHGAEARMADRRHLITVINSSACPARVEAAGDYLSIFALSTRCTGVTLRGCAYPLTDAVVENSFPIGVSNHIVGDHCEIELKTGTLLVMTVLEEAHDHE
ncbi:MAG: thiamine diphosphokinase [Angelakisella sp.]